MDVINSKIVAPKTNNTPLTAEVKERIKHDLNTRYQNEAMSLLLDICDCPSENQPSSHLQFYQVNGS